MKRYSPNEKVPMKFHNLYVKFLNPLGLLILAAISVYILLTALGIPLLPSVQSRFTGDGSEAARIMLWIMLGVYVIAFLFALASEILLAKRRPLGVFILILGYLVNVASTVYNAYKVRSTENLAVAALTVLIAILVCVYYWKRRRLFH